MRQDGRIPLGSGALASTTYPLTAARLPLIWGLQVTHNSIDAVSDRDFAIELASLSLVMVHLSALPRNCAVVFVGV